MINTDKINSLVRPTVTVMFAFSFCVGFAFGSIDASTFVGVASAILTWWFKSRDEKNKT